MRIMNERPRFGKADLFLSGCLVWFGLLLLAGGAHGAARAQGSQPDVGPGESFQLMCEFYAGYDLCPGGATGLLSVVNPSPLTEFVEGEGSLHQCMIDYQTWPSSQETGPVDEYREVCFWPLSGDVTTATQLEYEVCGGPPGDSDDEMFLSTYDVNEQLYVNAEYTAEVVWLTPSTPDCFRARVTWPVYPGHVYNGFEFRHNPFWLGPGLKTITWSFDGVSQTEATPTPASTPEVTDTPAPTSTPTPAPTDTPDGGTPTPTPTLPAIAVTDVPGSWLDPKLRAMFLPLLLKR